VRTCGEILLFNKFFPIVDMRFICEDISQQSCAMVFRWRIFGDFFGSCISSDGCVQHISDRRGKKEERRIRKIETTGQKYNGLSYSIGADMAAVTRVRLVKFLVPGRILRQKINTVGATR